MTDIECYSAMKLNKRNRSVNWDEEEKKLLRIIIRKYESIIGSKCLKNNMNRAKIKAWEDINKEFNKLNFRHRNIKQTQLQWKAMKLQARKNRTSFRKKAINIEEDSKSAHLSNADFDLTDSHNSSGEMAQEYNSLDSDGVTLSFQCTEEGLDASKDYTIPVDSSKSSIKKLSNTNDVGNRVRNYNFLRDAISHSKNLKEKEHHRIMEMAEEEHALKLKIHEEKLKCVYLEKKILELRLKRELEKNDVIANMV